MGHSASEFSSTIVAFVMYLLVAVVPASFLAAIIIGGLAGAWLSIEWWYVGLPVGVLTAIGMIWGAISRYNSYDEDGNRIW